MGWIEQLYHTYENLQSNKEILKGCQTPLAPVSHIIQNMHVEVFLDKEGNMIRISPIEKEDAITIVPCTEDSATRSSGIAPHMLYDNLKYVAGDAFDFTGDEKLKERYQKYCEQLEKWCCDSECPEDVKSIYQYIKKKTLLHDLIEKNIVVHEEGKLKWNAGTQNKPNDVLSTFVRFCVIHDGDYTACNDNATIINAYIDYDRKAHQQYGVCIATGENSLITYKHSAGIRYPGDTAKLISGGKEENIALGYEISQKAHSALRWLARNQGFKTGEQTVVVWSVGTKQVPSPLEDTYGIFADLSIIHNSYTPMDVYAKNLKKAVLGYRKSDLTGPLDQNKIIVMILEAATPGRLSIEYYKEFMDIDYLDNIEYWHRTCVWNHSYKLEQNTLDQEDGREKKESRRIKFTGAPSVNDIIEAAYGRNVDEKLKKHLIELLVACVVDRKNIPYDIVMKAVQRLSNPSAMKNWEHEKYLSITCALIKKYYYDRYKEDYDMAVNYENRDRSYLFGRVLAYAERIEKYVQFKQGGENRVPNAYKLRSKFHVQPARTLEILDDKLQPYVEKLHTIDGGKHYWMYLSMQSVISMIDENDYRNNKPLNPTYLLGYACQMTDLYAKREENEETENKINKNEEEF